MARTPGKHSALLQDVSDVDRAEDHEEDLEQERQTGGVAEIELDEGRLVDAHRQRCGRRARPATGGRTMGIISTEMTTLRKRMPELTSSASPRPNSISTRVTTITHSSVCRAAVAMSGSRKARA